MQRADAALELMLTDDPARASEVAKELDFLNRDRQEAETRILFAAEAAAAAQAHQAAIVVAGEGWHPGVVGIVASRLVERWRRPCVVIALDSGAGADTAPDGRAARRARRKYPERVSKRFRGSASAAAQAGASPRTTFTPVWPPARST